MRRILVAAAAAAAVLLACRPAQAFHHRYTYSQPFAPVAAAPMAAPISPGQVLQLVSTGLQVASQLNLGQFNLGQFLQGQTSQQQTTKPEPVPSDVRDTIQRVEAALPAVVDKSNAIIDLNKDLYKNLNKVSISAGTSRTGTGSTSHEQTGFPKD
jgi:hypothetical protein